MCWASASVFQEAEKAIHDQIVYPGLRAGLPGAMPEVLEEYLGLLLRREVVPDKLREDPAEHLRLRDGGRGHGFRLARRGVLIAFDDLVIVVHGVLLFPIYKS